MNYFFRGFEEIFPIFPFLKNKKKILDKVNDCYQSQFNERALFKFTLGLSVSLTVLAAASGSFVKFLPNSPYAIYISIICGIASLYMLAAGITALGAIKTLATYGYGTDHLLCQKKGGVSYLAEALYAQERMNIIRQMRNEAAYQSLRNGFLMLFLALVMSVVLLSNPDGASKHSGANVEEPSNISAVEALNKKALVSDKKIDNK